MTDRREYLKKNLIKHKILIYFHGNAEDIGHSVEILKAISELYHVILTRFIHSFYS